MSVSARRRAETAAHVDMALNQVVDELVDLLGRRLRHEDEIQAAVRVLG